MALDVDERTLIGRAVKRDPEAFAQLYIQFYEPVLRRVSSIVRDRHDAEDITSEAFLRAWNAIPKFQDRDVSILAWFSTIAERLAIKHVKKRRPSIAVEDVVLGAPPSENPDSIFEQKSEYALLRCAIQELPEIQREVVAQRFLNDLSYSEVGAATGKPVGTVRVIQHRALKALRVIIAKNEDRQVAIVPGQRAAR